MNIPELWGLVRRIDRLAGLEERHQQAIDGLREDLTVLQARVMRLESREHVVVAEAKAAAGIAASVAASAHVADLARRIGVLKACSGQSGASRLPSA